MIIINEANPTPPFEQIRAQLSDLIHSGTLKPGQRLPSIRQLAGDLRVATGTVARAYSELETAGLTTTNRATGTKVCPNQAFTDDVQNAASRFIITAQENSLSLDEALGTIRAQWRQA